VSEKAPETQTPTAAVEAPQPSPKKEGVSEIIQILVVAVAAAAIGVGIYFFMYRGGSAGSPATPPASQIGNLSSGAKPETPSLATNGGFVVIDSDKIASNALRAVQKEFQDNPSILPHLGEIGRIVGSDIQAQSAAYVQRGLLVYNASGLLGYPAAADRTPEVEQKVMADVQASVRRWIETAPKDAQPSTEMTAPAPQTIPGFEP
jgi:flagellar basal body-associated protein FliL